MPGAVTSAGFVFHGGGFRLDGLVDRIVAVVVLVVILVLILIEEQAFVLIQFLLAAVQVERGRGQRAGSHEQEGQHSAESRFFHHGAFSFPGSGRSAALLL